MARTSILGVVICKLGYGYEPSPIVLFEIDKGTKINLYSTILVFCLAINLRIQSRREPLFDVEEVKKQ